MVLGPWPSQKPLDDLRRAFPSVELVEVRGRDAVAPALVDADAFFGALSREAYLGARRLRWIQASSAGVEWMLPIPELIESDVVVTSTRGAHAQTIAEHVFAMLLTFTRQVRFFDEMKRERTWARAEGEERVQGLVGKTIGIVGLGNIGRAIARRAAAFDMRVMAVDAQPVVPPPDVASVWGLDRLHDLIRTVDVLAVAVPLTNQTRGMIGAAELALLKPSAYLFVLSRGGILQEDALASALRDHRFAGAGLDVTATEPLPPDSPLWELEELIVTPHVSAHSQHTMELMWSIVKENIGRFIRDEPLLNVVDKRLGY